MNPLFNMLNNGAAMNSASSFGDIMKLMRTGQNPMAIAMQLAQTNPELRPIVQAINSGANPEQVFRSECAKRGIDADQFVRNLQGK